MRLRLAAPAAPVRLLLALLVTALAAVSAPTAHAAPDPMTEGPFKETTKYEYNAGTLALSIPRPEGGATGTSFDEPLRGNVRLPAQGAGPFPLLVILHARHATCVRSDGTEFSADPCPDNTTVSADTNIRSYAGYDYLARNLASHGYAVASVAASDTVSHDTLGSCTDRNCNRGSEARAQIIAAHMDVMYRSMAGVGPGAIADNLTGRLDMNRVGVMGHSRGGDGAAEFVRYNRSRPTGRRYPLRAAYALAPVDNGRQVPSGVPFATGLPLCDGDVSNQQGARMFERSKYADAGDLFPKFQIANQGGNHNYYNTVFFSDDASQYLSTASRPDKACGEDIPGNIRLTPKDSTASGIGLMAPFFRRYLGGETAFEPYLTGAEPLPSSVCPVDRGVACPEEYMTSFIAGRNERRDVIRPEPAASTLTANSLGEATTASGFSSYDWCNPEPRLIGGSTDAAKPCPLPAAGQIGHSAFERENAPVNRSYGRQLTLAWDGPATLTTRIPPADANVSGFKALSMRAAVNFFDARNPVTDGVNPASATQDFDIVLTDQSGNSDSAQAATPSYGNALHPSIGSTRRHILLNGVRVPLSDFSGVDLTRIASIQLRFGRVPAGSIQLSDLAFQEAAVDTPDPVVGVRSAPRASGPDAIALRSVTTVASKTTCADRTKPGVKVSRRSLKGSLLSLTGTASDRGCSATASKRAKTGSLARVQVTVSRTGRRVKGVGKTCRFLTATGRLTPNTACTNATALIAKGKGTWKLKLRTRLPRGRYVLRVRSLDSAGNVGSAKTIRFAR